MTPYNQPNFYIKYIHGAILVNLRQVFFSGHIPQVTTKGHSIFAPKQHKKVLTVLIERGKP